MYDRKVHIIIPLVLVQVQHFQIAPHLVLRHKAQRQVHKNRRKIAATSTEIDCNLTQRRHP